MKLNKSKVTYTVDISGTADTIADCDKYVVMTFTHRNEELSKVRFPYDQWITFMLQYGRHHSAYDCYKMAMSGSSKMN